MNRSKKILLTSLILIFIGVIGSVFAYTLIDTTSYSEEKKIEESFTDISIDMNNEDVELLSTDDAEARVEYEGSKELKEEVTIEVRDHTLFMETVNDRKLFNINIFPEEVKLTVYLPDSIYETLDMKTDNGSFKASQLEVMEVKLDTNNGEVRLEDTKSETVNVTADNGNVYLVQAEGNISGDANNGSISLVADKLNRQIELETVNGNIELQTESEPENVIFDVTTKNGEVNLYGENDLNQVFGDGNHLVKLTTNNGDITVAK